MKIERKPNNKIALAGHVNMGEVCTRHNDETVLLRCAANGSRHDEVAFVCLNDKGSIHWLPNTMQVLVHADAYLVLP